MTEPTARRRRRRPEGEERLEGPPGSPEQRLEAPASTSGPEELLEAVDGSENPRLEVPARRDELGRVVETVEAASPAAAEHWDERRWRAR